MSGDFTYQTLTPSAKKRFRIFLAATYIASSLPFIAVCLFMAIDQLGTALVQALLVLSFLMPGIAHYVLRHLLDRMGIFIISYESDEAFTINVAPRYALMRRPPVT